MVEMSSRSSGITVYGLQLAVGQFAVGGRRDSALLL
jgi:hypothetical protein